MISDKRPTLAEMAEVVDTAAKDVKPIAQFTTMFDLDSVDAYAVQQLSIGRRLARGETMVGVKMGLTSRAKMIQVGVDEIIWGRLTSGMRVTDGDTISVADYVHPRLEPEIAFLMGAPLSGKVTAVEAMAAVDAVAPAGEIIDSRYENFKFAASDVIADNASSSGFVVGGWADPATPIDNLGMTVERNGRPEQAGSSAAILGDPVRSLVEASRLLGEAGVRLEPGWILMAGGATAAIPLAPGESYRVVVENLGRVGFSTTD